MRVCALLLVMVLAGCGHVLNERVWRPEEIIGYRLSEKSGAISFSFTDAGYASTVLSTSDGRDAGLILSWSITPDGTLLLSDSVHGKFATLKIVRAEGDHYSVDVDGTVREFRRSKEMDYYGWNKKA